MKRAEKSKSIMLITWTFIFGSSTLTGAADLKDLKPYEIEEGRIEYELSGMTKGSEVLEFKDWGRKAATRTKNTVSIMGMTKETDQLTLIDGEWVYNVWIC